MNKDTVKGAVMETVGKIQQTLGNLIGSPKQKAKGIVKRAAGKTRKAVGKVRTAAKRGAKRTRTTKSARGK